MSKMKTKTRKAKPAVVWTVTTADPYSEEPGYKAYVSVFATREAALQCLRGSAEEDKDIVEGELRWYDEDTDEPWVEVVSGGDVRWTHMLERKTVHEKGGW